MILVIVSSTAIIGISLADPSPPGVNSEIAASGSTESHELLNGTSETNNSGSTLDTNLSEEDLPTDSLDNSEGEDSAATTELIIEAESPTAINRSILDAHGADIIDISGKYVKISASKNRVATIQNISWVVRIHPLVESSAVAFSSGVESMNALQLHDQGVKGENVKIGILTGGVDPSSSEYGGQVAGQESFHPSGIEGDDPTHGTGVVEIVSDTAPNSELYLTSFEGSLNYKDATDWLVSNDVDVIVMSRFFWGHPGNGEGYTSQIAAEATSQNIFWANSAGNAADRHWQGQFSDPDDDGWHNFGDSDEGNTLAGGAHLSAGSEVFLELKWHHPTTIGNDYRLYLIDSNNNVVAESERSYSEYPLEQLNAVIPEDGRYSFAISGAPSSSTLEVYGSDNLGPIEYQHRKGSLTSPSMAHGVTAVGAYHVYDGQLASYSSAGPTPDGRIGLDVMGPSGVDTEAYPGGFYGTSAAAPHIGGAAGLLHAVNSNASATEIENAIMQTAMDMEPPGVDPYTGAGKANISAAAEMIDPSVNLVLSANHTTVTPGEPISLAVTSSRSGEPIKARILADGFQKTTDDRGEATIYFSEVGNYTVAAEAATDPITADYVSDSLTVSVEQPAPNISLTEYTVSDSSVNISEPISIVAVVENTGEVAGTTNVTFKADNKSFDEREISLNPGDRANVTVTRSFEFAGNHTLTVNDRSPTRVTVNDENISSGVTTSLEPHQVTATLNSSVPLSINASGVDNGVGSYNITVTIQNSSIAAISDVSHKGDSLSGETTSIADDGSTVLIAGTAVDTVDTGNTTIADISVSTVKLGTTTVEMNVSTLSSESGEEYDISTNQGSTVRVNSENAPGPLSGFANSPTDPDGDGKFEDTNGDGSFNVNDVTAIWAGRNSKTVATNGKSFDFNEDGEFNVNDVTALWNQI